MADKMRFILEDDAEEARTIGAAAEIRHLKIRAMIREARDIQAAMQYKQMRDYEIYGHLLDAAESVTK